MNELDRTVFAALINDKLLYHPRPWSIEYDWLVEIIDANGKTVAKMRTDVEANRLIEIAAVFDKESFEFETEFDDLMQVNDIIAEKKNRNESEI